MLEMICAYDVNVNLNYTYGQRIVRINIYHRRIGLIENLICAH